MTKTKWLLLLILGLFGLFFIHNAWFYSPHSGYDAGIHQFYTKILIFEKRIPTPLDTPESYNPPLFYFLSGKLAQLFSPVFAGNFLDALKSWQILIALLMPVIGYLWYDIFTILNRKKPNLGWFFLVWLLSLPVIMKMAPMYNIETPSLIVGSFIVWYFVKFVLPKPNLIKFLWLGIFGGIIFSLRIMSGSLLLSLGLGIILLWWFKKISFKQMLIYNLVFTVITLAIGGQYYYFYRDQGVFDSGENVAELYRVPFFQRQPRSFYLDTFFRTMMKTPIRERFPNRFIPIFYSTFWGDYWNYYRHRRYPLSAEEQIKFKDSTNKVKISAERLKVLAWQNRINLIPTLILIIGLFAAIKKLILSIWQRRATYQQISENFLALFFIWAFLFFFYTNIQFPNVYKGDTIKASYVLYAIPVLIYFAVKWLGSIQKNKWLFYGLLLIITISIAFNLNFDYF